MQLIFMDWPSLLHDGGNNNIALHKSNIGAHYILHEQDRLRFLLS